MLVSLASFFCFFSYRSSVCKKRRWFILTCNLLQDLLAAESENYWMSKKHPASTTWTAAKIDLSSQSVSCEQVTSWEKFTLWKRLVIELALLLLSVDPAANLLLDCRLLQRVGPEPFWENYLAILVQQSVHRVDWKLCSSVLQGISAP